MNCMNAENEFGYAKCRVIPNQGSISPTCLHTAYMRKDHKSAKIQSSHQCLFALWGSALTKAACKMLVKSTTGCRGTLGYC